MSHSKRNTSRPVFTSHERALAKSNWASSSARLGRDSFLPFGSCGLCLGMAREPVACPRGDVFCRECALASLVAQKKDLRRAASARRQAALDADRARALDDDRDRARAVGDFEMVQAGLAAAPRPPSVAVPERLDVASAAPKRKFALDDDELRRIASEDRAKARRAMEDEKAAKPTLPSFWTPSLTPDVQDSKLPPATSKDKTVPMCPSSPDDGAHAISLQKLVTVRFSEDAESMSTHNTKRCICPACLKALSNSSRPVMAVPCGHVLCLSCVKKFLLPSAGPKPSSGAPAACYVCDTPLVSGAPAPGAELPPGLVPLRSEGTGFSARGASTVARSGVAFQC